LGSFGVSLGLYEEIQDFAFTINGTPQEMPLASNNNDHFIEMPNIVGSGEGRPQVSSNRRSKFQELTSNRFVGNIQSTFCEQIFYISITQ